MSNVGYGAFHSDPFVVPSLMLLIQADSLMLNLLFLAEVYFSFLCFPQPLSSKQLLKLKFLQQYLILSVSVSVNSACLCSQMQGGSY